ncbi:hypothetical protein Tco_1273693 [Tanacetum coccineum]
MFRNNFGNNTGNNNRVENVFKHDNANNNGTNNSTNNVVDRFLVYVDGLEPFLLELLENGQFVPKSTASIPENFLPKPQKQWTAVDRRLANQDKRQKSNIISCLPNDTMKVDIKCYTAKEMWNDLILSHEGPSETRDTKIAALRLKFNAFKALEGERVKVTYTRMKIFLKEHENKDVKIAQAEVNVTFLTTYQRNG